MKENTTRQDKRGRVLRTAEERQELVEAFNRSGLGIAEFCQQRNLWLSTFNHWANSGKYGRGAGIEVELPGGVRIQVWAAKLWPVVTGC